MNTFDKLFKSKFIFIPDYCLDLNNKDYGLISFILKDVNYDNINGIVINSFNSGPTGYRYMRIYNNKGELLMTLTLLESLRNDDNIFILCDSIKENCNWYMKEALPWWWLYNGVFYMHIINKDVYGKC